METAGSRAHGTQRIVVTQAERQVADLLPVEVAPELARATVQAVPFWFHTFALNRPTVLTRRVPRAITAIAWRWCRPILPGCACSTSVRLMASTRSSPSAAGPSGWWRRQRAVPAVGRCPVGNRAGWPGGLSRDPSAAGRGGRACVRVGQDRRPAPAVPAHNGAKSEAVLLARCGRARVRRLKREWAMLPLRVRGLDRVRLHADLTILARLTIALGRARARAVPLAA
jgi:hypothetical protein